MRLVYNSCLEIQKSPDAAGKVRMSRFDLQVVVKEMKKEKPFLKEVNSQSLQYPVYSLTRAYINYEEGHAAHPVFKKKYARQAFHCPQYGSVGKGKLFIPKFREGIPMKKHRPCQERSGTLPSADTLRANICIDPGRDR